MRKNLHWLLLTTVFMLSIAMAGVGTASPASPVIRVEPKNNTADVGETFAVNITVTGITEERSLYGWEFRITFNPNIINAVNVTERPFLKDTGYETFWRMEINNTAGTVDALAMLFDPETGDFPPEGASGTGVLATVTFEAVGQGATDLEFKDCAREHLHGDTELYTIPGPDPILHTAESGFFRNVQPIPLQLIAGIVVVVAVCTVAVFYFRRRRTSTRI